jgi:F-type H+-transporting ATPase subunit b
VHLLAFAVLAQAAAAKPETTNPILPATNELIWGAISFTILFIVLAKLAWPGLKKGLDDRAAKIRGGLDEAEKTRTEAQQILDEYKRQLTDAKSEAARIIEEARQAADRMRTDLRRQAETEVAELRQRAQEDINAQVQRAMADLHAKVAELAIELAEKVVERNLDRDTNLALIESYINQVSSQTA